MPRITNTNSNPRGKLCVAIGKQLLEELREVSRSEERPIGRQVALIIREWLERRKNLQAVDGAK